jgi:hypothetical protein
MNKTKVSRIQLQAYAVDVLTVEEAMNYAQSAAAEAYAEAKAAKCSDADADYAAGVAYRNALPLLKSRGNVQAFIATVADGVAMKFLSAREGGVLLYAAKLAIAAHTQNTEVRG